MRVSALALALGALVLGPATAAQPPQVDDWVEMLRREGDREAWLHTFDLASGLTTVSRTTAAAAAHALSELPFGPAVRGPGGHVAVGHVRHACLTLERPCYEWGLDSNGDGHPDRRPVADVSSQVEAVADAYGRSGMQFPLSSGEAHRVWGSYVQGVHRVASPGVDGLAVADASPHSDRSLHGVGVGTVVMYRIAWGPDIYFGHIHAHGQFTFCDEPADPVCASLAG